VPKEILAIVGPPASGKSALALEVARHLPVEIVSCDSQQVYVGMDIGTGKPPMSVRQAVPHHLLDVVLPTEPFHAARWAALARAAIRHIIARGRVPLVVGGTGLYLRALLVGLFDAPPPDEEIRARHKEEARLRGVEKLHARLASIDPETAAVVQPRDLIRVSRALEVFEQTGAPISALRRRTNPAPDVKGAVLFLDPPLGKLREMIAARFDSMMMRGLLAELETLRARFGPDARALSALGYRQLGEHLDGTITETEAIAAAKTATIAYARRQRTWFRGQPGCWRAETVPDAASVASWWRAGGEPIAP
jgi:tRNA dimethylallyltransferase